MIALMSVGGCGEASTGPGSEPGEQDGMTFVLADAPSQVAYGAAGLPAASGGVLDQPFAVAVPDSLGGLVLIGYDAQRSDLLIMQVGSTAADSYECGPVTAGAPCHGRYFENVRMSDGVVEVDGRLDLSTGTLVLEGTGSGRVTGSFDGTLERSSGTGPGPLIIQQGRIDVPLLDPMLARGGLDCLIRLTTGETPCEG